MRDIEKEQMGNDLVDIVIGLARLFWRLVQRSYRDVHQQPPQDQQPPPEPPQRP